MNDEVIAPIHTLEHDGGKAPAKRLPPSPFCPADDAPMLPSELAVYDALAARAQSGTTMATACLRRLRPHAAGSMRAR